MREFEYKECGQWSQKNATRIGERANSECERVCQSTVEKEWRSYAGTTGTIQEGKNTVKGMDRAHADPGSVTSSVRLCFGII